MTSIRDAMDDQPESPAALVALGQRLASVIDATEDPDAIERLSRRLLDVLRELGWTPRGVGAVSDEWHAFTEYGGATVRDITERARGESGI